MTGYAIAFAAGAIAAVAYPPVNAYAVKARDWLYGLFKRAE